MKRVYIIHGWDGTPQEGWFPWLKKKLEAEGVEVHVPAMPDSAHPTIDIWVPFLQHLVGQPDDQTFFIGHSVGCQTILRYLERLSEGKKVGGVVLVAGWTTLKSEALADEVAASVAAPWLQRPINWPKIRAHVATVTAIHSDDDQFVSIENGKVFTRELGATLIVEHQKRHLGGEDGIMILHSALVAIEGMLKK